MNGGLLTTLVVATTCAALLGCSPGGPRSVKTNPEPPPSSVVGTAAIATADVPSEKTAVLEALRVPIEGKLGQSVVFKTDRLTVQDGWAFVRGQTLRPDGEAIDYSQTPYKEAVAAGAFDDGFSALLHVEGGSWKVLTFSIGSTDVPWVEWPDAYGAPPSIFPPL